MPLTSFALSTKPYCIKRLNEHSIIGKPSYYEEKNITSRNQINRSKNKEKIKQESA